MKLSSVAIVFIASAALPLAALAQTSDPPRQDGKRDQPRVTSENHVALHEWFDRSRRDGVTEARQSSPLDLSQPNGRFTLDSDCHWPRRNNTLPPLVPMDDDQEDQEPEKPLYPIPTGSSETFFRDGGAGLKFQFTSTLSLSSFSAVSPSDGTSVSFDSIDASTMPGVFLSTTVGVGNFDMIVFADYITGRFSSSQSQSVTTTTIQIIRGNPVPVTTTVNDNFDLSGTLSLMEIGVAPILKRFATDDGIFRADLAVSGGFYWGRLSNMTVNRSGSVAESFSLPNQNLIGLFAGPTAQATLRVTNQWRVGAFGEFWRLFGDAKGWTGLVGAEVRLDF